MKGGIIKMKVLVIGGAGYIGSHIVYEFIRDQHEVVVLDNLSTGARDFVHQKARFYLGDMTKREDLVKLFTNESKKQPFDVVVHCAAKLIVPESLRCPLSYYYYNVEGVRLVLEVMNEYKVKNFVFSSTAAVYGNPLKFICEEEDEVSPINPYGESKLAAERMIKWVAKAHDINYCIFRYFNVAGADKSLEIGLKKDVLTHLIPTVMQVGLGLKEKVIIFGNDYETVDGTCIRDYIHVSDLADAHVLGAKHICSKQESILLNLGSNDGYSVKEVISEVRKHLPVKVEIGERRDGDPAQLIASSEKAKIVLGWKPQHGLDSIIASDLAFRQKLLKDSGGSNGDNKN